VLTYDRYKICNVKNMRHHPLWRKSKHVFQSGLVFMEIHGRVARPVSKHLRYGLFTIFARGPHFLLSQPYFGQVWGWSPTLGKAGIWSPPGLPDVQSSTAGPKTPRIGVFLVSLESSWSVDIESALALGIWTSVAQVMGKRRAGSRTGSLTPDH
jgi:hypothetical protein